MSASCKHQSGHDGVDTRTTAPGVKRAPGKAVAHDCILLPGSCEARDRDRPCASDSARTTATGASISRIGAENPIPSERQRRLALFNEQAEIFLGSRFAATMFGSVTGVTFSWEEGGSLEAKVKGPDDEAVRAFALTFRMFFRDRDGVSFREMAEIYGGSAR